jgi:hypothetical protein
MSPFGLTVGYHERRECGWASHRDYASLDARGVGPALAGDFELPTAGVCATASARAERDTPNETALI